MSEWEDIERLLKQDAEKLHFEFQEEFWDEVATELDVQDAMEAGLEKLAPPFEFQEEYWDEMSAMLDESDRNKRRGIFFYWMSGAAAVLLLLSMVFNVGTSEVPADAQAKQPTKQSVEVAQDQSPVLGQQKSVDEKANTTGTGTSDIVPVKRNQDAPFQGDADQLAVSNGTPENKREEIPDNPVSPKDEDIAANQLPNVQEPSIFVDPADRELTTMPTISTNVFSGINIEKPKSESMEAALAKARLKRSRLFLTTGLITAHAPEGNSQNGSVLGTGGYVGLGYAFHLKRLEFRLGANVAYRTGINHDLVYNRRMYGTQLFEETDEVSYKGLSRLELPLEVCYSIGRNTFGFGVTPVWNAGVNSTYHKYNSYNDEEMLVRNNFGIREGVNDFDLRLSLNYEKRLSPKFTVGGRASLGLLNQIDTDVLTDSEGFKELSGSVYVKYNILAF